VASIEPPAAGGAVEPPVIEPQDPVVTGILDLYRSVWRAVHDVFVRHRVAIVVELALIAAWFVLRTVFSVESRPYLVWTIVAAAIALISPTSGLVILAATAPFFEPVSVSRALGMRHLLVAALGVSVLLRLVAGGWRQLPRSPALILGGVLAAITAAGVVHTVRDFDPAFGTHAAQMWLATIGGAMILLLVGAWVARTGEARPLIAAAIACAVASVLSLVELVRPGLISNGVLSWIGFWKDFGVRITGIIPAPNAVATMLLVPATVSLAAIGHFHGRRRLAAVIVAVPITAATILTLSRSAIGAVYFAAVLFIARRRHRAALIVLGIGLVLAVVSIPLFIQFRANREGVFVTQSPIEWIVGADEARVTAWTAAIRMWGASPFIGHGFLAYKMLADSFGDTRLGSPHNEVLRLFAEEGLLGGLAIVAFIVCLLRELARRPGWIGAGVLAGVIGYWLAAMFNNPLLFIQVSVMAFVFAGYGLTAPIPSELQQAPPTRSRDADLTGSHTG
jgi:O-antigen ligase